MKQKDSGKIHLVIGANELLLAGVQRLVVDQARLLDRSLFEIHLIILMRFPGKETFDELIPDDVIVHQMSFRGLLDIREWIRLFRLLRKIRPHVVKTAMFFSNTIFLALRPLVGYVVVAAEHNTVSRKRWWQRLVDRILLPHAYTVVGDSQAVVEFVSEVEHIDKKHFTVVYNGVDLSEVAKSEDRYRGQCSAVRAEYSIPADAHVVFNAARLVGQKNHALMIEGFARLRTERDDVYLVIAGDGGLRSDLEALAEKLKVADRVIFLGEQKDIHRFYAMSDSFLLTSRHEGFCIAAMEALAFGMPLVSTRVAGVSEYLKNGENGFFVEANPQDIAQKLLRVVSLSAEERVQFATFGKDTAKAYSTERYGEVINDLMKQAGELPDQL